MIVGRNSENGQPLTWMGSVPLYVTTLLVGAYCVAMAIEAILRGFGVEDVGYWLLFSPTAVFYHFNFWRLLTYPFLNEPSIWFLMEMAMLFLFGREVERFVGRRNFLFLYFVLVLIPPACITLLQFSSITTAGLAGSWNINFAIFISFVTLYPRAEIFFGIAAKWVAVALVGIRSLESFGGGNWVSLGIFWLECFAAILLIRAICSGALDSLWDVQHRMVIRFSRRASSVRKKIARAAPVTERSEDEGNPCNSIDPILEKISRCGIGSLTRSERQCLEKARAALLEKERWH